MFEKLSFEKSSLKSWQKDRSDPEVIADQENWRKVCREPEDLSVEKYREYKKKIWKQLKTLTH